MWVQLTLPWMIYRCDSLVNFKRNIISEPSFSWTAFLSYRKDVLLSSIRSFWSSRRWKRHWNGKLVLVKACAKASNLDWKASTLLGFPSEWTFKINQCTCKLSSAWTKISKALSMDSHINGNKIYLQICFFLHTQYATDVDCTIIRRLTYQVCK